MDEGTLRRRVGDARTIRDQLDRLIEVSRSPKVKVLVVPDTAAQGQIADHPDIVKACDQVFDTLRAEPCLREPRST
jgi:hypothetical protein